MAYASALFGDLPEVTRQKAQKLRAKVLSGKVWMGAVRPVQRGGRRGNRYRPPARGWATTPSSWSTPGRSGSMTWRARRKGCRHYRRRGCFGSKNRLFWGSRRLKKPLSAAAARFGAGVRAPTTGHGVPFDGARRDRVRANRRRSRRRDFRGSPCCGASARDGRAIRQPHFYVAARALSLAPAFCRFVGRLAVRVPRRSFPTGP